MAENNNRELRVEEWLKKARDDELNARSILTHRDGTPTIVCFLSQQMAEKYLKAFLVFKKQWFPKIHQLDLLVVNCAELDKEFEALKENAVLLNDYYTDTRYPGDFPEYSWSEAKKAFEAAFRVKEFVLGKIEK